MSAERGNSSLPASSSRRDRSRTVGIEKLRSSQQSKAWRLRALSGYSGIADRSSHRRVAFRKPRGHFHSRQPKALDCGEHHRFPERGARDFGPPSLLKPSGSLSKRRDREAAILAAVQSLAASCFEGLLWNRRSVQSLTRSKSAAEGTTVEEAGGMQGHDKAAARRLDEEVENASLEVAEAIGWSDPEPRFLGRESATEFPADRIVPARLPQQGFRWQCVR